MIFFVLEYRYDFGLEEDEENGCFILDVSCPRFMDTTLIDCDVHPTYVRVTIKGKILQLVLTEEVSPDKSSAERSTTTGHLVVRMPKAKPIIKSRKRIPVTKSSEHKTKQETISNCREFLELPDKKQDLFKIIDETKSIETQKSLNSHSEISEIDTTTSISEDFIDDPSVPPLI